MNQFSTFALVVGLLCLVFAVWIRFRAGEKYMKLFSAFTRGGIPILAMLAVVIVDLILIYTVCKKDSQKDC